MTHTSTEQPEALRAIRALREYIEAIPKDVADNLPAMPGVDGDWLDSVEGNLEAAQAQRVPLPARNRTHQYKPDKKYPWFCDFCGYAKHDQLMHGITQEKQG